MTLFNGDAPLLLAGVAAGKIEAAHLSFKPQASVVKYLVPADYPDNTPDPVDFNLDTRQIERAGFSIAYASVRRAGQNFQTLGSRTLAIVGLGETPAEVSARIEALLALCQPAELRHRKDVGDGQILQDKVERMAKIRGEKRG